MDLYVAGSSREVESIQDVQNFLRERGHNITFDWTSDDGEIRRDWSENGPKARYIAETEVGAVHDAESVVFLWPSFNDPVGALLEVGVALGHETQVYVIRPLQGTLRESVFWYLPYVTVVDDMYDLITEGF